MMEEIFKAKEGSVLIDKELESLLPIKNLDNTKTVTGGNQ